MMIRCVPLALALVVCSFAVKAVDLKAALVPSPISIALTVGQWLMKDERKAYYVQVEATAENKEVARNEAFRLAVEMAVGAVVVAETEVKNNELVRKEIVKYSSGYIDNFVIKSEAKVGDRTRLVIDVWVGESKIADRLLNVSKGDGSIDGARIAAQSESMKTEKANAAKLVELVGRDYPARAFDIKVGKTTTTVEGPKILVEVPIMLSWNARYLDSLLETIEKTKDGEGGSSPSSSGRKYIVSYRKNGGWITHFAIYKDSQVLLALLKNFVESKPQLRISFKDDANVTVASNCRVLHQLSGNYYGDAKMIVGQHQLEQLTGQFFATETPNAHFGIYGDYEASGKLKTAFNGKADLISKMRKIEVEVVRKDVCDDEDESMSWRPDVLMWCRANQGNGKKYCPIETR